MRGHIKIDFSRKTGSRIRRLNGGNLGPKLYPFNPEEDRQFAELEIPLTRLHDVPLANPGMRLVDIQHIFGNWKADASNPDNYYFSQTDDCIRRIRNSGSEIMYRLGTSIEHCEPHYYAFPPEDFEKWTQICINIIRHYNEGWCNGFHDSVKYWEIWNEPDDSRIFAPAPSKMWNGTAEEFCRLYTIAARQIKARFPGVKVGGASFWKLDGGTGRGDERFIEKFLDCCRREAVPLDFFSWHSYSSPRNPFALLDEPLRARMLLDSYGFHDAELHLAEWRYVHSWNRQEMLYGPYGLGSAHSAVHAASVLIGWQDTPLTMGEFYMVGAGNPFWSCWRFEERVKDYYAFRAFAGLLRTPERVEAHSSQENIRVLAGTDGTGTGQALIADFATETETVEVDLHCSSANLLEVFLLDAEHNLQKIEPVMENDILRLPAVKDAAALYFLRVGIPSQC